MRVVLSAVLLLQSVSSILMAQSNLPTPINFPADFTMPTGNKFIFSDTSYKPARSILLWNSAAGSTTSLNNYYRINGSLNIIPNDEVHRPLVCNSDTSYLRILNGRFPNGLTGSHDHTNPLYGIALHYDVCAPNRTKTVAGTSASYQETYPDWTDPSGGGFGFLTRNSGTDSVFADGNKR